MNQCPLYDDARRNKPDLKVFFLIVLMLFFCNVLHAQNFFPQQTNYGVRFGIDYEMPGKNLSGIYNPAPSYHLGFIKYGNKFTWAVTLAYRQLMPKQSVTKEQLDFYDWGTTELSPYSTYSIYLGWSYNIIFSDSFAMYAGLDVGKSLANSSASYTDYKSNAFLGGNKGQGYAAPKIGALFAVNNNVDFDLHASYNVAIDNNYTRNSRGENQGDIYTTIAPGVSLIVKF